MQKLRTILTLALSSVTTLWGLDARAAAVLYDVQLVSAGTAIYEYTFTLVNDGALPGAAAITGFGIEFDNALYEESSLSIIPPEPSGWVGDIFGSIEPDIAEPAYDAFTEEPGVGPGESLTGFIVAFDWLGPGEPGAQPYYFYDANTFQQLAAGMTSPLPLPPAGTMSLISIAALSLFVRRRRRRA